MLKRPITYTDFDDNVVTEDFYFNLTKSEMIELIVEKDEGLDEWLKRIVAMEDRRELISEFKRIILLTYGVKSPDGKRFVKSDELRSEFAQTPAYDALFMELATNENAAADFINGVMPKDLREEAAKGAAALPPPVIQPVVKEEA